MTMPTIDRPPSKSRVHPMIERFHFSHHSIRAEGRFTVRRGRSLPARLAALVLRLPHQGRDVPLSLVIERNGSDELWDRVFAGRTVRASFRCGRSTAVERVGALELIDDVLIVDGTLRLVSRSASLRFGSVSFSLPRWLSPRIRSRTWVRPGESCLRACVVVSLPLCGLLLAYRGFVQEVA